jgi:hypothetical protein
MESARGECGDKIFSSHFALSDSKHLSGFGNAEERSTRKHKRRHILCCFMKDDDERRERRRKGKSAFILLHFFMTNIIALYGKKMFRLTPKKHPLHAIAT